MSTNGRIFTLHEIVSHGSLRDGISSSIGHGIRMMRFRSILLFATLLLAQTHAQDLRIRQQDPGGVLIEYRPAATITRLPSGETRVDVVDGVSAFGVGDPRVPQLRTLLGLPSTVGNRVTVVEMDYRDEQGVDLAPSTVPRQDGEEPVIPRGPLYSASGFIPAAVASLENVGVARDRMFGDLVVNAVQYNPATRVLRVFTRILLRVDFGSARERFATVSSREEVPSYLLNAAQARAWKLQRSAVVAKATSATLASGQWYRIVVAQTGVYRLSRAWFNAAGIDVASLDPRTIRMFSSGGRELPRDLDAKRPEPLQEVAIDVVGGDDGRFDESDYVQFFGMGTSGFDYNPASGLYEHYINRFADENVFLMTFGGAPGKRIAQQASLNDPDWCVANPWRIVCKWWAAPKCRMALPCAMVSASSAVFRSGRCPLVRKWTMWRKSQARAYSAVLDSSPMTVPR